MGPINSIAEIIRRDQKKDLIPPMDPFEISVALNGFNLTYLNDRFSRTHRPRDRKLMLQVLERVWVGTLYGTIE